MVTTRTSLVAGWLLVAVVLWVTAVPGWISASTFCWINLAALALGTTFVTAVRSAGPTRSIAHILYDTEHPVSPRR